jgi:hypothetical protein
MAITSTGYQSPAVSREGLVPSVHDTVILIGAQETPLLNLCGTSNVEGITHSWIIDKMPTPTNTPQLELSGFVGGQAATKQKNTNAVQITTTEVMVTKTMQKAKTYGGDELSWETQKQAKAHAIKLEYLMFGLGLNANAKLSVFQAPVVRTDTVAGQSAGLFYFAGKGASSFLSGARGNVHAFDSNGDWSGTTNAALTWDIFNQILQPIWAAGEVPKDVFVGSTLKAKINNFIAAYGLRYVNNGDKSFSPTVSVIETDFGTVNIHMHRFLTTQYGLGDAIVAGNFDYVKQGLLIPTEFADVPTDKTAIAKRYYTESTLECRNADAISIGVGLM